MNVLQSRCDQEADLVNVLQSRCDQEADPVDVLGSTRCDQLTGLVNVLWSSRCDQVRPSRGCYHAQLEKSNFNIIREKQSSVCVFFFRSKLSPMNTYMPNVNLGAMYVMQSLRWIG